MDFDLPGIEGIADLIPQNFSDLQMNPLTKIQFATPLPKVLLNTPLPKIFLDNPLPKFPPYTPLPKFQFNTKLPHTKMEIPLPKLDLNFLSNNLSIPFTMSDPAEPQNQTKIDLSSFLSDLKTHITGESEISGPCFYTMILIYLIVICAGVIGNGLGKFILTDNVILSYQFGFKKPSKV